MVSRASRHFARRSETGRFAGGEPRGLAATQPWTNDCLVSEEGVLNPGLQVVSRGVRKLNPAQAFAGANRRRIRTAQFANRDKHGPRRLPGPEPAVSGSEPRGLDGQDPAESRRFLSLGLSVRGKSLQQQTRWRWAQSIANSSLSLKSLIHRENTGKLSGSQLPASPASPIRPVLAVLAGVFPEVGNREIPATEHGFAGPESTSVHREIPRERPQGLPRGAASRGCRTRRAMEARADRCRHVRPSASSHLAPAANLVARPQFRPGDSSEVGRNRQSRQALRSCKCGSFCSADFWHRTGYHQQARVENTFFRYKSIIGDRLRSRHPMSQKAEALIACNILNRVAELGRPQSFAMK
jgi:hypothetical protein